jgi:hypothetical protein
LRASDFEYFNCLSLQKEGVKMEENKLCYYNMGAIESNKSTFFIAMKQDFGIDKKDMEQVVSGYRFLFDSETNTYIRVAFYDNNCQIKTEFIGEMAEDVIVVYKSFANRFYNKEEGEVD